MRLVAIAYVLLAILVFSVTYPFLLAASETFSTEADLATALGVLSAAVTATSFVVSVVLANRVYARFGVTGAALLLPIVYLGGFGLWLVAFSFATAALVRFTQQVTQRGISNSAWSAFYNVVPRERRAQVLAFNDGVPGQIGTILSGLLLLAAGTLLALDQVFWLGVIAAIVCTIVVLGIRRGYRASVLRTPQDRPGRAGPRRRARACGARARPGRHRHADRGPRGARTGGALMAAGLLAGHGRAGRSGAHPGRRRRPRSWRAGCGARGARDAGRPAERRRRGDGMPARRRRTGPRGGPSDPGGAGRRCRDHRYPSVDRGAGPTTRARLSVGHSRASTARTGRTRGRPRSSPSLLAGPGDAARLVGLETDRRLGGAIPADRVTRLVDDPSASDPGRRPGDARGAAGRGPRQVDGELVRALDDDAAEVRATAARALSDRESTPAGLLDVLSSGSNRAQEAALTALRGHGPDVRQAVIAWTLGRLERATELRRARAMLAASEPGGPPAGTGTRLPAGGPRRDARRARSGSLFVPWSCSGCRGRRRHPALPPLRRCRDPGAGDRGPRLHRRPRAPAAPSSGCSKTRRSTCGIAMPRLPGWPMMTTRGSAAWRGGSRAGADVMPDTSRTLGDLETMMLLAPRPAVRRPRSGGPPADRDDLGRARLPGG